MIWITDSLASRWVQTVLLEFALGKREFARVHLHTRHLAAMPVVIALGVASGCRSARGRQSLPVTDTSISFAGWTLPTESPAGATRKEPLPVLGVKLPESGLLVRNPRGLAPSVIDQRLWLHVDEPGARIDVIVADLCIPIGREANARACIDRLSRFPWSVLPNGPLAMQGGVPLVRVEYHTGLARLDLASTLAAELVDMR